MQKKHLSISLGKKMLIYVGLRINYSQQFFMIVVLINFIEALNL